MRSLDNIVHNSVKKHRHSYRIIIARKNWFEIMIKKMKIALYCSIGALVIGGGIGTGIVLNQLFTFNEVDYSGLDIASNEENVSVIMKKYRSQKSQDFASCSSFKTYEKVLISEDLISEHDKVQVIGVGDVTVVMGIKQSVRSASFKVGNEYLMENISSSQFVSLAKRFIQKDDTVSIFQGDLVNNEKANWNDTPVSSSSVSEHEEVWGKQLSKANIYIISSKTVLDSNEEKEGDNTRITLTLDPVRSVLRYIKQMVKVSDLDTPPVFKEVKLSYLISNDMKIVTREIYEVYDVTSFGVVSKDSKGYLKETFNYDGDFTIPTFKEDINYK